MKQEDLHYPPMPDLSELNDALLRYSRLAAEFGNSDESQALLKQVEDVMQSSIARFSEIVARPQVDGSEPEDISSYLGAAR